MNFPSANTTGIERDGEFVVVIGPRGHPNMQEMAEGLSEFAIVSRVDDVRHWDHERLRIIRQGQVDDRLFAEIMVYIQLWNQLAEFRLVVP